MSAPDTYSLDAINTANAAGHEQWKWWRYFGNLGSLALAGSSTEGIISGFLVFRNVEYIRMTAFLDRYPHLCSTRRPIRPVVGSSLCLQDQRDYVTVQLGDGNPECFVIASKVSYYPIEPDNYFERSVDDKAEITTTSNTPLKFLSLSDIGNLADAALAEISVGHNEVVFEGSFGADHIIRLCLSATHFVDVPTSASNAHIEIASSDDIHKLIDALPSGYPYRPKSNHHILRIDCDQGEFLLWSEAISIRYCAAQQYGLTGIGTEALWNGGPLLGDL